MSQANILAQLGSKAGPTFRNRIINGAMVIDQRNAGASVSVQTTTGYTLDRFKTAVTQNSKFTVQQNAGSVTPPIGFTNYLGCTSSSAYSIGAGDYFSLEHVIEGFNTADLGWGTANAKTVTVSFWVYASLTGTYSFSIRNYGSYNRSYVASYTVSVANTWQQVSVTIAGDTTGTWTGATNNGSLLLDWGIGVGSTYSTSTGSWQAGNYFGATGATSVVGTSGATFYITGVQLEVGSSATGFEYRQYGQELALCQRYYEQVNYNSATENFILGYATQTTTGIYNTPIQVKRATPTVAYTGTLAIEYGAGSVNNVTAGPSTIKYGGGSNIGFNLTCGAVLTIGQGVGVYANGTAITFSYSAEL